MRQSRDLRYGNLQNEYRLQLATLLNSEQKAQVCDATKAS